MLLGNIGVFVPAKVGDRPPPKDRPLTRAVNRLSNENIRCIFGFSFKRKNNRLLMEGLICEKNEWIAWNFFGRTSFAEPGFPQPRTRQRKKTKLNEEIVWGQPLIR